ncbi:MAG: YkgJ family cysteine cluster protein [Pseudomonadota bacterium]
MAKYNCMKCPGYCCSYPVIVVTKRDITRLAKAHELSVEEAERTFTRAGHGHKRIMQRQDDEIYGRICRFFCTENRRCTTYGSRPEVCRAFPGEGRCGYYDFLKFERKAQDDPAFVALTNHAED